jgi:hypothetical protein
VSAAGYPGSGVDSSRYYSEVPCVRRDLAYKALIFRALDGLLATLANGVQSGAARSPDEDMTEDAANQPSHI